MKRKSLGILNGMVAAISYGTNPLFALPLYAQGIKVNSVLFYRYAFAIMIYFIWIKFVKKVNLKLSKTEILILCFLAILFSLSSLTLFDAFNYIDAGIACTILFIYPVLVAIIMAIFFKEKLTKTTIFSIILTTFGISLLYNGENGVTLNPKGICIIFLSAILYALYIVGIKKIKIIQHINRYKLSFYIMFFGLLVYIFNLKFCTQLQILTEPKQWLLVLGLSLFPTIISLETINISIKLIGSTLTAILGALEPLTAIFFGVLIFHEQLTMRIVAGVCLILSGVFLVVLNKSKASK